MMTSLSFILRPWHYFCSFAFFSFIDINNSPSCISVSDLIIHGEEAARKTPIGLFINQAPFIMKKTKSASSANSLLLLYDTVY
jgi:hypothetical protein